MERTKRITKCLPVKRSLVAMTLLLITVHVALGYDVNKDLRNLGPPAHDLTVVLSGSETVTNH